MKRSKRIVEAYPIQLPQTSVEVLNAAFHWYPLVPLVSLGNYTKESMKSRLVEIGLRNDSRPENVAVLLKPW